VTAQNPQPANNSRRTTLMPIYLALAACAGLYGGTRLSDEPLFQKQKVETLGSAYGTGRMEEILQHIRAKYVDDINEDSLSSVLVNNTLSKLDPHSYFISPEEGKEVSRELEGSFEGIGIEFLMLEDSIHVAMTLQGSPAQLAGIRAGEILLAVNDVVVSGPDKSSQDPASLLSGKLGTKVRLKIVGTDKSVRQIVVARSEVAIHSIESAYMLDKETGMIKIARFSASTHMEFVKALKKLAGEGLKDLIIDLRQNPGGFLEEAELILNELFTEKGKILVYTQGRSSRRQEYKTTGRSTYQIRNISVLIDEGSASASEIIAGAVQDWDRGPIVGRRSYGKGLVQEQFELRSGGILRLTVARYYTPLGRCLQSPYQHFGETRVGVKFFEDTTTYTTLAGRILKAGGGVSPDYPVAVSAFDADENLLSVKTIMTDFALVYVKKYGKTLPTDFKSFRSSFSVNEKQFTEFVKYVNKSKANTLPKNVAAKYKAEFKHLLKSHIGKLHYNAEAFFLINGDNDPVLRKAYEVIRMNNPLKLKYGK
jgi:carboxyl-terminal processing protease